MVSRACSGVAIGNGDQPDHERSGARWQAIALAITPASSSARTLSIAAAGTLLVTAVFSAFVVTLSDSARSFDAGVAGEAWALSGMSLGLATALLTAGALADDLGHRRVLTCSAACSPEPA
jgi:MFS family permease